MFQWTDGEVSHVVKLALESLRGATSHFTASDRHRLIEALATELAASAWHAHTIESALLERDRQSPWRTIASDGVHDWSQFAPLESYVANWQRLFDSALASGSAAEEIVHRSSGRRPEVERGEEPPQHALAWLAVQPEGNCACVEFLKRASAGPFTMRDQAVLRILSTELLAEPVCSGAICTAGVGAAAVDATAVGTAGTSQEAASIVASLTGASPAEPRFADSSCAELCDELPRRQREVLTRLLLGSSVKEIASELGISPYTVNDYIKALYRRYQVSSRGELMAAMHGLRRPAVPK